MNRSTLVFVVFAVIFLALAACGDPDVSLTGPEFGTMAPAPDEAIVVLQNPAPTLAVPLIPTGPIPLAPTMMPSDGPEGNDGCDCDNDDNDCDHHDGGHNGKHQNHKGKHKHKGDK